MERLRVVGAVVTITGLGAYVAGTVVAYTGRAFSLTMLMVGLTLIALGGWE